ncbi:SCO-spondin-like, partial [Ostrea edulis]|uniref:SCO-spondin-like n=1 Tax=Ostrea edulis TaxID=37623 RepID=UPI0024AFE501
QWVISGQISEHDCRTISCSSNQYIDITYAHYGIQYWCDASNEVGVLDGKCYGKESCSICATNSWFGDPCVGTFKYLWYNFDCKSRAVNGNWGSWSSWGSCTRSCASGTKSRSRSCNNPAPSNGGSYCSGSSTSSTSCNTHNCPVHGGYTSWSSWGGCSKTCGSGSKSRTRSCTNPAPAYGGNDCSGASSDSTSCNTHNCPIHGNWANWGSWGTCTVTCGGGTKVRARTCTNPAPQYSGNDCAGASSSSTDCNTHNCPIDGNWATWGSYGSCTVTCGGGVKSRSRTCTAPAPQYGGAACADFSSSSRTCNTHNCPIDGEWAVWGTWGTCTVTCGGGTQTRSRTCTNPSPQYNGVDCPGSGGSSQDCNTHHCPIDGVWATWGSWGTCTVTCGGGTQDRFRTCSNPNPQYGGADCPGASNSTQDCNTQICIIDGAWGTWTSWGACSKTCGGGKQSRSRTCDDPKPANGGKDCSGSSADFQDCNSQDCPTPAPGQYQQLCPSGYFTCKSGGMSCIQSTFQCDCSSDCDDGSDEDATYAGCTNTLECLAKASAENLSLNAYLVTFRMQFIAFVTVVFSFGLPVVYAGSGHIGENACYTINCGSNAYIDITYAYYGIKYWCDANNEVGVLDGRCYGKSSCSVCATNSWFGDPCVGTYKYMWFNWDCKSRAVNGNWGGWGSWGSCNRNCGSGTRSRSRSCNNPAPSGGGQYCSGSSSSSSSCNTHNCPRNGGWSSWGSWGSCTRSCGSGTKTRTRSCNNPSPAYGGSNCAGSSSHSTSCNTHNCPIHGGFSSWSAWGACTKSCASGTKTRTRSCTNPAPAYGGNNCVGATSNSASCNTHNCPIHGGYTSWSAWGSCSKTCASGTKLRTRSCTNPTPQYGGNNCAGSASNSASCNTHNCPIHGNWAAWGSWGTCTVTCGGGTKVRGRTCTNPAPQYLGNDCVGSSSSSTDCNTHHCPIDGNWATWGSYGSCTVTCGGGLQSRSRTCSAPAPQYGGAACVDFSSSSRTCNTHNCPIDGQWASWGSWRTCSVTCGGGTQTRSRTCTNPQPQYNGANCPGSDTSSQNCNTHNCPIDGKWASWGSWGTCTVTCGGGTQDRTRTCTNPSPQYGGANCPGSSTSTQSCNTQVCIIDGAWGAWQAWGSCSKTCGGGKRSRARICDNPKPANGGLECTGSSGNFDDCNTQDCPTVAAGTYQQLCPSGYFTCQSGSMTCIQKVFQCDCASDCDDGSDEDASYAGCTNTEECLAKGSAADVASSLALLLVSVILAIGYTM